MNCAETYIGGPLIKGISGGERKRTSVGVELVTKPSLIFLVSWANIHLVSGLYMLPTLTHYLNMHSLG